MLQALQRRSDGKQQGSGAFVSSRLLSARSARPSDPDPDCGLFVSGLEPQLLLALPSIVWVPPIKAEDTLGPSGIQRAHLGAPKGAHLGLLLLLLLLFSFASSSSFPLLLLFFFSLPFCLRLLPVS